MKKFLLLSLLVSALWAEDSLNNIFGVERLSCSAPLGSGTVVLTWLAPENIDAEGIRILRDGVEIETLELTATTFTDRPGLTEGEVREATYSVGTYGGSQGDSCPPQFCRAIFVNGNTLTDLVLKLQMNGDGKDTAPQAPDPFTPAPEGNDATLNGEITFTARGSGEAASFDTDGEAMILGKPADFDFGAETDFTISLLVRIDDLPAAQQVIAGNQDTSNSINPGWSLAANPDGSWQWNLADGLTSAEFVSDANLLSDGDWHHLLVVHDRDQSATLYFDGQQVGEVAIDQIGNIDSLPTGIATDGTLSRSSFIGGIDEVEIWRRRLIPAEISLIETGLAIHVCPANFQAAIDAPRSLDSVNLTWTSPRNIDLTGYEILRDTEVIATLGIEETHFFDAPPSGGETSYTLRSLGPDARLCSDLNAEVTLRSRLQDGLQAFLRFEGDTIDDSGQGNDGTLSGDPSYVTGIIGQSLSFDDLVETKEYVELGSPEGLTFGEDTDFTVSVWVLNEDGFPDRTHLGGSANDPAIIGNKDSRLNSNQGWHIGAGNNRRWQWSFSDGSTTRTFQSGSNTLSDNEWHHLLVVHDRDGLATFYKNGQEIGSRDISSIESIDSGFPTAIATDGSLGGNGAGNSGSSSWFHGQIDEVRIWNRALSASEIMEVYREDSAYLDWRVEQFEDTADGDPSADPDFDGIPNLLHFAMSNDPVGSFLSHRPRVKSKIRFPQITYRRRRGGFGTAGVNYRVSGLTYEVEQTSQLDATDWESGPLLFEPVGEPVVLSETFEEVTVRSTTPVPEGEQRFLRLRVRQR